MEKGAIAPGLSILCAGPTSLSLIARFFRHRVQAVAMARAKRYAVHLIVAALCTDLKCRIVPTPKREICRTPILQPKLDIVKNSS